MCLYVSIFVTCFITCSTVTNGQKMDRGSIGFPESEENPNFENKPNRQPVFLPSMCPTNELYYPGDQQYDWICDCRPGYLYHPATDACWLAYQRGPCPKGQYLVLPKTSVIPVCEINPCIGDNLVMWHEKCETLGSFTPCGKTYPASALWVNATTITIDCVKIYMEIEPRFSQDNIGEQVLCPPGCKRSIKSQCVPGPRS